MVSGESRSHAWDTNGRFFHPLSFCVVALHRLLGHPGRLWFPVWHSLGSTLVGLHYSLVTSLALVGCCQLLDLAGRLLGESLTRHPTMTNVALHFAWHKQFSANVLAALSTSQQLQDLLLYNFEGTLEQCSCLLPVLFQMFNSAN